MSETVTETLTGRQQLIELAGTLTDEQCQLVAELGHRVVGEQHQAREEWRDYLEQSHELGLPLVQLDIKGLGFNPLRFGVDPERGLVDGKRVGVATALLHAIGRRDYHESKPLIVRMDRWPDPRPADVPAEPAPEAA